MGKKRTREKKLRGKKNKKRQNTFSPIALALCRSVMPELFAHKVVSVQPMATPVGLSYAMRMAFPITPTDADSFKQYYESREHEISSGLTTTGEYIMGEEKKELKSYHKKNIHVTDGVIYVDDYACPEGTEIVVKDYFERDGEITKVDYNRGVVDVKYVESIIKYYDEKEDSACDISLLATWVDMVDNMDKKDLLLNTMHKFEYVSELCRARLSGTNE